MPKSKNWISFAVRKGVPTETGVKVLAVRTHDHDEKEALFLGTIKDGYGAGKLTKFEAHISKHVLETDHEVIHQQKEDKGFRYV